MSRPAGCDRRKPRLERPGEAQEEVRVERRVEPGGLVRVRPRDRDAVPLAPHENAAVRVDRHRDHGRKVRSRPAHEDVPPHRLDGHVEAGERRDAPRAGARGDHDGGRLRRRRPPSSSRKILSSRRRSPSRPPRRAAVTPARPASRRKKFDEAAGVDEAVARPECPARDRSLGVRGKRPHAAPRRGRRPRRRARAETRPRPPSRRASPGRPSGRGSRPCGTSAARRSRPRGRRGSPSTRATSRR